MTQAERSASTVAAVLAAAGELFARNGFENTSIDEIAAGAGVAKGAVYHHFASKEAIFEQVFQRLLADVSSTIMKTASGRDTLELMLNGTRIYLEQVTQRSARRILLIDGPAVLGWQKWRDIDLRQFGEMTRASLRAVLEPDVSEQDVEAVLQLLSGAITEAAQVAATARNRRQTIENLVSGLRSLLAGLDRRGA